MKEKKWWWWHTHQVLWEPQQQSTHDSNREAFLMEEEGDTLIVDTDDLMIGTWGKGWWIEVRSVEKPGG